MSDSAKDIMTMASLETGLKVLSLCSTGFFTGGSAFFAYAFEPGVMGISNHCGLVSMRAAHPRFKPLPLSIVAGTIASAGLYAISVKEDRADVGWLVGTGILGATIPFTLVFSKPICEWIMNEEDADEDKAPEQMGKFMFYHYIRTAAVGGLFAYYAYKLAK
eukprot:gene20033-21997_t